MADDFHFAVSQTEADILAARSVRKEVFVDEQGIPAHLDPDGRDETAFHVLCRTGDELVGTGRFFVEEDGMGVLSRIAVRAPYRGSGLGREIVRRLEAVAVSQKLTRLSLQPHKHLEAFYGSLGYHTVAGTDRVGEHELITMEKHIGSAAQGAG